jgi:uncharacterized protein YegJ (DUF2314 family)
LALLISFGQWSKAYSNEQAVKTSGQSSKGREAEPKWNIVSREQDDPELLQAKAQALKEWPKFLGALSKRKGDQIFDVKACISDGTASEHVWVSVRSVNGQTINGSLDNEPHSVKGFRSGQQLRLQVKDIEDWLYYEGENPIGGFTIPILTKRTAR